jgi:hypothetical protein
MPSTMTLGVHTLEQTALPTPMPPAVLLSVLVVASANLQWQVRMAVVGLHRVLVRVVRVQ